MTFRLGVLTYHVRPTRDVRRAVVIAFQRFQASMFGSLGLLALGFVTGSLAPVGHGWAAVILAFGYLAIIIEGWTTASVSFTALARMFRWGDRPEADEDDSTVDPSAVANALREEIA